MSPSIRDSIKAKQRSASKGVRDLWQKSAASYGPFYGLYRGKVVNNIDPLELNRLLIDVPTLPCSISSFAYPASPYGGEQVGMVITPPIGASIWVKFENGDPSTPVWVGCFWTEGQKPALAELPTQQVFSSGSFEAMVNDIPVEAEHLMAFTSPGFAVPVTGTVTSEVVTFSVAEVLLTVTPEEVSLLMEPASIIATNASFTIEEPADVTIQAAEVGVEGNTTIEGAVEAEGNVNQVGAVEIEGAVNLAPAVNVEGSLTQTGTMDLVGTMDVIGAVVLTGVTNLGGLVDLAGDMVVIGGLEVTGNVTIEGVIEVGGEIAMAGAVEVLGVVVSAVYSPGVLNTI